MKYDFETIIDRTGCGSSKWDAMHRIKPEIKPGIVPLSVADMEFMTPPEIIEGLQKYIASNVLGYTKETDAYYEAVIAWQKKRHNLDIKKEWIETSPGIIPALSYLVEALTKPGEGVIIMPPVYYPFSFVTILSDRQLVKSPLMNTGDTYLIDFDDFEKKAKDPNNTLLIFCNPHNPVGRVWTKEELKRVMDICIANHVFVIDDEIHNDLIMPGYEHTPTPALSEEAALHCAYCTSSSKTFNLAGMQASNIIIPDPAIRARFAFKKLMSMSLHLNALGYESCRLAYTHCEQWLEELLLVIDGNAKYMSAFFKENLPEVKTYPLEGTYLFWVDFSGLGMTHTELEEMMVQDGDIFLDEGYMFGPEGRGFERFNLACPRKILEDTCERLLCAVNKVKSKWETTDKPIHIEPKIGEKLPDFYYNTPFSSNHSFSNEIQGKATILLFHRYYSCLFSQSILKELASNYDKIAETGGQIKVVLQSKPDSITEHMNSDSSLPFDIICDSECELYNLFNVFPASSHIELVEGIKMQTLLNMGISLAGLGTTEGELLQLPAVIGISPDGSVGYINYGKNISDIPSIPELVEILINLG